MTNLLKKLNFKNHPTLVILNSPPEFETELKEIEKYTTVLTQIDTDKTINFVLAFVQSESEINHLIPLIDKQMVGDGIVWFAYPKKTSKKYKVTIHRDHGWDLVRQLNFDTVRAVAIDDDWSTLRFRRNEYIKG